MLPCLVEASDSPDLWPPRAGCNVRPAWCRTVRKSKGCLGLTALEVEVKIPPGEKLLEWAVLWPA
eukprot:15451973-Alexandrium_andersonii.AAC.1